MKRQSDADQAGFIPLLITIIVVVVALIYLVYVRVNHASH